MSNQQLGWKEVQSERWIDEVWDVGDNIMCLVTNLEGVLEDLLGGDFGVEENGFNVKERDNEVIKDKIRW